MTTVAAASLSKSDLQDPTVDVPVVNDNDDDDIEQLKKSSDDGSSEPVTSDDEAIVNNTENGDDEDDDDDENPTTKKPFLRRLCDCALNVFYKNSFTFMILFAIALAKLYPELGAVYLQPQITSSWLAVALIFFLVGVGLKLNELTRAIKRVPFNTFVQTHDILFISVVVFGVTTALKKLGWLNEELADGMVVCACLPVSVNAAIIMTSAANGDEGAAVFNTALGNFLGVFVSPALIVAYLKDSANVDLGDVMLKLTLKVLVPFAVGQLAQRVICKFDEYYQRQKPFFKKCQEVLLAFIVYTVFCKTFKSGESQKFQHIGVVILFQFLLMVTFMIDAWFLLKYLFPGQYKLHVMGIFGCTQKTIALGVPLIQSMYGDSPYEALYTLPILIWHPMQLVVGSTVTPWLKKYIERESAKAAALEAENALVPEVTSKKLAIDEEENAELGTSSKLSDAEDSAVKDPATEEP